MEQIKGKLSAQDCAQLGHAFGGAQPIEPGHQGVCSVAGIAKGGSGPVSA